MCEFVESGLATYLECLAHLAITALTGGQRCAPKRHNSDEPQGRDRYIGPHWRRIGDQVAEACEAEQGRKHHWANKSKTSKQHGKAPSRV